MKNIMLLGVSRCGKSTLARMIKDTYSNYQIISGDMVKVSYQKNMDNKTSKELRNDPNYRKFIKDIFIYETIYGNYNYILDSVDVLPSDIAFEDTNKYIIVFLGCNSISAEDMIKIWKLKDNEWLKNKSVDELLIKAKSVIDRSNILKEKCKKYNFKYIDTSNNRDIVLMDIFNYIKKVL